MLPIRTRLLVRRNDPLWSSTVYSSVFDPCKENMSASSSLGDGNGTQNNYFFKDARGHSISSMSGACRLNATSARFGSMGINCTNDGFNNYQQLFMPDSDDWDLGNRDFGAEWWVRFNASAIGARVYWYGGADASGANGTIAAGKTTANKITCSFTDGTTVNSITGGTSVTSGIWYHVAQVRIGGILRLYLNGAPDAADVTITAGSLVNRAAVLGITCLGQYNGGSGFGSSYGTLMWGDIDQIRFTKASCRYPVPFNPPGRVYPVR